MSARVTKSPTLSNPTTTGKQPTVFALIFVAMDTERPYILGASAVQSLDTSAEKPNSFHRHTNSKGKRL